MTCRELVWSAYQEYIRMDPEAILENGYNAALVRYLTLWNLCGRRPVE